MAAEVKPSAAAESTLLPKERPLAAEVKALIEDNLTRLGADVVSGTSCSLLPAGPWVVVRWGVRRVRGLTAGVARGGAGVGARSARAAALLRGRFGSCSPVSVSSVRCLCCRDVLWASGYLACLVWSRLAN